MSESFTFDPQKYGPALAPLLNPPQLPPLDAGEPNLAVKDQLQTLNVSKECHSALWLLHNFLDESHVISQDLLTSTGSYWHGIMHRREPDFSNAKYWFRKVGQHPVFEQLCTEAAKLAENNPVPEANYLANQSQWEPFAFVDLCERALGEGGNLELLCQRIQLLEWQLLFDWCYQQAIDQ